GMIGRSVALTIVVLMTTTARAELVPEEVAVIAMARSAESRRLADYYVQARGIPESHICLLSGEPGASMRRDAWEHQTRPEIYAWLNENELRTKIRCFVTVWDVPLKIERRPADGPVSISRKNYLAQSRRSAVDRVADLIEMLDASAAGDPAKARPELAEDVSLVDLAERFKDAIRAAQLRARAIESSEERKPINEVLERAFLVGSGLNGMLRSAAQHGNLAEMPPEVTARLQRLGGQLQGLNEGLKALDALPDSVTRDIQMLGLIQKTGGLLSVLQWMDQQLESLRKNETYSSFDSELSLLHWPDYPLTRWQPNLMHYRWGDLPHSRRATVMVSRLEAPTLELARKLIDTAIATEEAGLKGKVYLDSRGIPFDSATGKQGSYGQYDQSLRDLADRLTRHTKLEVVLNEEATLFQAGDCPDTAIYCGWYSLARYVDAFDFNPGAVGYHMASSEASTLRKPGGKVWCNAMLEDGIGATLGPTAEPYLAAFPLPDEFFSLLLTGRYTLVEAYYRTKPYNSWAMVLVGDPLYNPFKKSKPLAADALPVQLRPRPLHEPE
ncbi:MAG: TIGR03790 family protein, partial [Thermoguttaceae bacterium]